jgi:hypothetical protein
LSSIEFNQTYLDFSMLTEYTGEETMLRCDSSIPYPAQQVQRRDPNSPIYVSDSQKSHPLHTFERLKPIDSSDKLSVGSEPPNQANSDASITTIPDSLDGRKYEANMAQDTTAPVTNVPESNQSLHQQGQSFELAKGTLGSSTRLNRPSRKIFGTAGKSSVQWG